MIMKKNIFGGLLNLTSKLIIKHNNQQWHKNLGNRRENPEKHPYLQSTGFIFKILTKQLNVGKKQLSNKKHQNNKISIWGKSESLPLPHTIYKKIIKDGSQIINLKAKTIKFSKKSEEQFYNFGTGFLGNKRCQPYKKIS